MPDVRDANVRARRPGNQLPLVSRRTRWLPLFGAVGTGLLLSAAFPPLVWWPVAWVALAPLLWLGLRQPRHAFVLGYVFGLAHFATTFAWLRPVFVLAPLGLGAVCALYPAVWLALSARLAGTFERPPEDELRPRTDPVHPLPPPRQSWWHGPLLVLLLPALWVALEWVRSWAFTGFPWNLLGVSQWSVRPLLPLVRFTGVPGLSFLIVAANVAVALAARPWTQRNRPDWRPAATAVGLAILLFIPVVATRPRYDLPPPRTVLRVGVCQGNIPQIREYRPDQLEMALETYLRLTEEILATDRPDLVVWPETAVPAPLTELLALDSIREYFLAFDIPMLIGSVEARGPADGVDELWYNSALLLDPGGEVGTWYDKMKIVPFGEFVPFRDFLPWLVDWIGMGRDLTRGDHFTLFELPRDVRTGVNICYEDVFPEISRGFARRGADMLVTITNDAWYEETSGSRQHMVHAVFRAVETCRPMLRSGNNADTCLILPTGDVRSRLVNPTTGNPFYRGAAVISVPVRPDPPETFYVRHGDLFARLCSLLGAGVAVWVFYRWLRRKQRLAEIIAPDDLPSE